MKNFNQFVTEAGPTGLWNYEPVSLNGNDTFDITNPQYLKE